MDSKLSRAVNELEAVLNGSFSGYLGEAMALGNKIIVAQRILRGELFVEAEGVKLLTAEQMEARDAEAVRLQNL